ncbi:MAG: energy-coupling factor ABC transporter permease, partial [Planctomycetaceae bacterium]
MHLANSAVSPECIALSWVGAATGISLAVRTIRKTTVDRGQLTEAVLLTSVVFAGQMINVPVLSHTSIHLIGGALLAWWMGPALSTICMTSILAVQAVFLGMS